MNSRPMMISDGGRIKEGLAAACRILPAAAAGSAAFPSASSPFRGLRSLVSEFRFGGERDRRSNREALFGSGSF